MPLQLKGCLSQTCDGVAYQDTTGVYNAETNPGGYGSENGVESPSALDTYTLSLWAPGNDYYAEEPEPTVVLDLLLDVPTPDPNGYYTWTFTPEQLDLLAVKDGVWYWEARAEKDADVYTAQGFGVFLNDLRSSIDAKMKPWDPTCPCKNGCADIGSIYMKFNILECGGICDPQRVDDVIKWLNSQLKNCC